MGKIRVATLGVEEEQAQKDKTRIKREQKKLREGLDVKKDKVEKVAKTTQAPKATPTTQAAKTAKGTKTVKKTGTKKPKKVRSKRYQQSLALVDRKKTYTPTEAIELAKKTAQTKFVASIEAHFNLNKKISVKNSDTLKVERKAPLAHGKVGKVNESTDELEKKLATLIKTIGANSITKLTLSSSMGPGMKVAVER